MRTPIGERLVVHAMIGGDGDDAAEFDQLRETPVERMVKFQRFRLVRRVAMLHIVGQREIQQFGPALLHKANAGVEHEQREVGRIHVRLRPTD